MRIINTIVQLLGLTSVAFAAPVGFNLRQAASGLILHGGKVIESGIATTNKIVANYGPSIVQGAGEMSEGAKNGAFNVGSPQSSSFVLKKSPNHLLKQGRQVEHAKSSPGNVRCDGGCRRCIDCGSRSSGCSSSYWCRFHGVWSSSWYVEFAYT